MGAAIARIGVITADIENIDIEEPPKFFMIIAFWRKYGKEEER